MELGEFDPHQATNEIEDLVKIVRMGEPAPVADGSDVEFAAVCLRRHYRRHASVQLPAHCDSVCYGQQFLRPNDERSACTRPYGVGND